MTPRNPYVLLGLPYGASREQANVAFARRARALRRLGAEGKAQLTELTWALNQIDEAISDPDKELDVYRIPADPDAFEPKAVGLFNPPPERMARTTDPSTHDASPLVSEAVTELLRWEVAVLAAATSIPEP